MPALRLLLPGLVALLAAAPAAGAAATDRDRDLMPDRWEKRHKVRSAKADHDRDGLTNLTEALARTNPRRRDTDRDGLPDGREDTDADGLHNRAEQRSDHHPRRRDSDGDGVPDGKENAGVVTQVAGAVLTVRLFAGGSLTASLGDDTFLDCARRGDLPPTPPPAAAAPEEPGDEGDLDDEGTQERRLAQEEEDAEPPAPDEVEDPDLLAFDRKCRSAIRAGAVVREAELEASPEGPVIVSLALVSGR